MWETGEPKQQTVMTPFSAGFAILILDSDLADQNTRAVVFYIENSEFLMI